MLHELYGFTQAAGECPYPNFFTFFFRKMKDIHLYGRGQGALLALLAALFHEKVVSLTLKDAPCSWLKWAQMPLVTWPAADFVKGVLAVCDLEDCLRVLRERLSAENVHVVEPWGPEMAPVPESPA